MNEFERQIDRLADVYGEKKYPMPRREALWNRFNLLPAETFKQAITDLIAKEQYAPMQDKFMDLLREPLRELLEKDKQERLEKAPDCFRCNNEGVCIFYSRETGDSHAFRCKCERGKLLYPAFPEIYSGMGDRFASHRQLISGEYKSPKKLLTENEGEL